MAWRFALSIYKDYYRALFYYFSQIKIYKENYGEFIKSFFAELENSDIPDWAKHHFVDTTINHPIDFESIYYANQDMILNQDDKTRTKQWENEQYEGFKKTFKIIESAEKRYKNKSEGTIYEDEEKYNGLIKLIEKNGGLQGLFNGNSTNNKEDMIKLYTNFVTQGRSYNNELKLQSTNSNISITSLADLLNKVLEKPSDFL